MHAAAFALVLPSLPARALDLDDNSDLIAETIAGIERRTEYDPGKKYGATPVLDKDRGFAEPDGLRAGNFLVYPSAGVRTIFDDNIFGAPNNAEADLRSEFSSTLQVRSQLPRHVIDLSLAGNIVTFLENEDQNYANYAARAAGALHFDHAHTISATAFSSLDHEERGAITAALAAAEPTPVYHHGVSAGITRDAGRLYGTLSAKAEMWDYQSVAALGGGTLDQNFRDQEIYSAQLRMGYRFSPGFETVGKVRALRQTNAGAGAADNDSVGYEALAGVAFETGPLVQWRLLGGYGVRQYDEDSKSDAASSLLEAEVRWLPTERATLTGSVSREILDTIGGDTGGGRIETKAEARLDYEIYHNIIASAGIGYSDAEFIDTSRQDETWTGRIGVDYYHTKNWLFSAGYEYQHRDSTDDAFDVDRNRFMVGAKLRF